MTTNTQTANNFKSIFESLAEIVDKVSCCSVEEGNDGSIRLEFSDLGGEYRNMPGEPSIIAIKGALLDMKHLYYVRDIIGEDSFSECMDKIVDNAAGLQERLSAEAAARYA